MPRMPPRPPALGPVSLFVVALALPVAWPGTAEAYVRSTVDDVPGGIPLFWGRTTIEMRLASTSIPGVDPVDAQPAFRSSLRAWSLAGGCTSVVLIDGGEVTGLSTNLQRTAIDMENRVVFRASDWPPELGPETLALTSAVYRRTTGEIVDADIDLNGVDHVWSAGLTPLTGHDDVQNTLTHELGHVLGFGHTSVRDATMYASAALEEKSKRDLAEDDINAICDVYPGGSRGVHSSCSAHAVPQRARSGALAWGLVALVLGARRISRRRPTRGR